MESSNLIPEPGYRRKLYADLELPEGSKYEDIRAAYRRLCALYHPDVNSGTPHEKWSAVQHAHEILSDEKLKAEYDRTGVDPATSESVEGRAHKVVSDILTRVIEEMKNPDHQILNTARQLIKKDLADMAAQLQQVEAVEANTRKALGNINKFWKGGPAYKEIAAGVLETKLGLVEKAKSDGAARKEVLAKAIELLKDSKYEPAAEPVAEKAGGFIYSTIIQGGWK